MTSQTKEYKKAFMRCALLFLVGTTLQVVCGPVNLSFFRHPVGLILAINFIYLAILIYAFKDKWRIVKEFTGIGSRTATLTSVLVLLLFFGLIRQDGRESGLWGVMGFTSMQTSWQFGSFMLLLTLQTGIQTVSDLHHLRKSPMTVFHFAIFIILLSGIFGSGDTTHIITETRLRQTATTGINRKDGRPEQLPFGITLMDFSLNEYAPKIQIADYENNVLLDEYAVADSNLRSCTLNGWKIEVLRNMPEAIRTDSTDTETGAEFKALRHVGAVPALYVRATDSKGQAVKGWISCGSFISRPATLTLNGTSSLVMMKPEPKEYISKIIVSSDRKDTPFTVRVNHPARFKSWRIYQHDYDSEKGKWSDTSVLEAVKDPWYPVVKTGLYLLLAGSLLMFFIKGKKHIHKKDKQ